MHILCILNNFPGVGLHTRKQGTFPVAIKSQVSLSNKTAVLVLNYANVIKLRSAVESLGADLVGPLNLSTFKRLWQVFRFYGIIRGNSHGLGLIKTLWTYSALLAGMDDYIVKAGKPDVAVALQNIEYSGIFAWLIHERYNVPFVVWDRTTHTQRGLIKKNSSRWKLMSECTRKSVCISPVSPQLAEVLSKHFSLPKDKIVCIPNPAEDSLFDESEELDWIRSLAQNRFIFGSWTNWRKIKRIDVLLTAFLKAMPEIPDSCLVVAGNVPKWTYRFVNDHNLSNKVYIAGEISRKEIRQLANSIDCCLIPSDHETFGLPAIEALAAGKPVITTKCGGPESIVDRNFLGRVVPPASPEALAEAMIDIVSAYDSFDSERIKNYCSQHYGERAFHSKWQYLYSRLGYKGS